jgi:hypothetical protein
MHELIGLTFRQWMFSACYIFEADDPGELSAKYGSVKMKCLFGIAVEGDVRIDEGHVFGLLVFLFL